MAISGVCLCYAPGITERDQVNFSMNGRCFELGANHRAEGPFVDGRGNSIRSAVLTSGVVGGPVAKIEFFLTTAFGEYIASPTQPGLLTGYMANGNYTGRGANRHRRGTGRYFLAPLALIEQLGNLLRTDFPIPKMAHVEHADELLQVVDAARGAGSNLGAWFSNFAAVLRGSGNQCMLAWLKF